MRPERDQQRHLAAGQDEPELLRRRPAGAELPEASEEEGRQRGLVESRQRRRQRRQTETKCTTTWTDIVLKRSATSVGTIIDYNRRLIETAFNQALDCALLTMRFTQKSAITKLSYRQTVPLPNRPLSKPTVHQSVSLRSCPSTVKISRTHRSIETLFMWNFASCR